MIFYYFENSFINIKIMSYVQQHEKFGGPLRHSTRLKLEAVVCGILFSTDMIAVTREAGDSFIERIIIDVVGSVGGGILGAYSGVIASLIPP
jgi:hypothetical protein